MRRGDHERSDVRPQGQPSFLRGTHDAPVRVDCLQGPTQIADLLNRPIPRGCRPRDRSLVVVDDLANEELLTVSEFEDLERDDANWNIELSEKADDALETGVDAGPGDDDRDIAGSALVLEQRFEALADSGRRSPSRSRLDRTRSNNSDSASDLIEAA